MSDEMLKYCPKCKKTIKISNFYKSNNLEKYPDGYLDLCKQCITLHVDNWDPSTYLWILQEADVPYVPNQWNLLMAKYAQDKTKVTGATILGRYLAKMALRQWKPYRWNNTNFLQEVENKKIQETMERQGYDAEEIASVIQKGVIEIPDEPLEIPEIVTNSMNTSFPGVPTPNYYSSADGEEQPVPSEDYFGDDSDNDIAKDLTDEDKLYLRLKWGKTYKPEEWVRLEQFYEEMMAAYDIQTPSHIDNLKLLCKTSLKANQLIDIGD